MRKNTLKQCLHIHSVHWGINPARKHHSTLPFISSPLPPPPPLNLQTVQVTPF